MVIVELRGIQLVFEAFLLFLCAQAKRRGAMGKLPRVDGDDGERDLNYGGCSIVDMNAGRVDGGAKNGEDCRILPNLSGPLLSPLV